MSETPTLDRVFMTPAEVAALFRVDPKTVARWADAPSLPHIRTPRGHRRFTAQAVQDLINRLESDSNT